MDVSPGSAPLSGPGFLKSGTGRTGEQENKTMARTKNTETTETTKEFPYIPFTGKDDLPMYKTDSKGNFAGYGEPRYGYRKYECNMVELISFHRKPKGVLCRPVKRLKLRNGRNADEAFYRKLKDNNIPEID
jgi:hypothetical protein